MTYLTIDQSVQDGAPVWLYTFARGTRVWRFTSAPYDYVGDDGTYLAVAGGMRCAEIESSAEKVRNNPECEVSREHPIAELFRVASPTDVISVRAREVHRGDTDYAVRFVGEVSGAKWDGAKAKLQFISIIEAANGLGLKLACTRGCQAMLFGPGCNLNSEDFEHATTITAIDGLTVTVDSVDPALPYPGGQLLVVDDDGNFDRRMIEGHETTSDGEVLTLTRRLPANVIATDAVVLLPGCDHTIEGHCLTVYDNTINFRGRPHFAGKNPMGGTAVF